jgi:hypothetical protein
MAASGVILLRSYVLVVEGDRVSARWFLWGAIAFPSQSQSAEYIHIKQNGDRLSLASVSKAERPFGLEQAAVSGVILLRSYVLVVQGDRVSARCFLWGAIVIGLSHRASKSKTRP